VQVATALFLLTKDNLLPLSQRVQSVFIISELFRIEASQNPFLDGILTLYMSERDPLEKWFIGMILSGSTKEVQ